MPDPVWPVTLPAYPLLAGYDETFPDTVKDTPMDSGPPKARQTFTAGVRPINCNVKLANLAAKTVFEDFVRVDLAGRALPFTWAGLSANTGGGTGRFRIIKPPAYSRDGAQRVLVKLSLIRLP